MLLIYENGNDKSNDSIIIYELSEYRIVVYENFGLAI